MGNIYIDTDCHAPGCPCMIVNAEDTKKNILVQTDWDYPGFATTFGWDIRTVQVIDENDYATNEEFEDAKCSHNGTDGTIACPQCGCTADKFISSAYDFLTENDGKTVEDPGYF